MKWKAIKEFLKPNRIKILLTLTIPFIWFLVILILSYLGDFIKQEITTGIVVPNPLQVLGLLFSSFVYYPFSCSLITLFDFFRKGKLKTLVKNRFLFGIIISGMLIFNPVSIAMASIFIYYSISSLAPMQPCGVYVSGVWPDSAAEGLLKEGDVIVEVNDQTVRNVTDFSRIIEGTKPNDEMRIQKLDGGFFMTHLGSPPPNLNTMHGFLGINASDAVCKKI